MSTAKTKFGKAPFIEAYKRVMNTSKKMDDKWEKYLAKEVRLRSLLEAGEMFSYEQLSEYQPIRQGDIFYPLPRPKLLLDEMETISEDAESEAVKWSNIKDREKIFITIEVEKTWGIVATQNYDAAQSPPCISLFQVVPFIKVYASTPSSPSKWVKMLTERICRNASWFYLPKDDSIGISIEMAVNFHRVFQIEQTI